MKYIEKGNSPQPFEDWKNQEEKIGQLKYWDTCSLDGEIRKDETKDEGVFYYSKEELRQALLEEQGFICCYCNRRIENKDYGQTGTVIEHLLPKHDEKYPELTFEYLNLLASCRGGNEDRPPENRFCDAAKGNKEINIHPLMSDCETHFSFTLNGKIKTNSEKAEQTLKVLNLDCDKLNNLREEFLLGFEIETLTKEEAITMLRNLENRNNQNQFIEFGSMLKDAVKRFYNL